MNLNQDQNNDETIIDIEEENSTNEENSTQSPKTEDKYKFGWSSYSEITNGRFAMLGFIAIILIELFSQKSFLDWAGIF